MGGDFNAGAINWGSCAVDPDSCAVDPDSNKKSICRKILDIFDKFGLTQLQKQPTREGAILDLFAT